MREILFRGKKAVYGEWVEGFLVKKADSLYEGIKMYFILRQERKQYGMLDSNVTWIPVKPESVGQFTGLKDANGKRIFEGDIIQIRFEGDAEPPSTPPVWYETGKVIWHEQLHGWYVIFDSPDGVAIQEYNDCDGVFVIGNIHDNPELKEEQND